MPESSAGGAGHPLEGQREAVVEFPPGPQMKFGAAQLKPSRIDPHLVATAIASAIAADWAPLSRGKTAAVVVDAAGGRGRGTAIARGVFRPPRNRLYRPASRRAPA